MSPDRLPPKNFMISFLIYWRLAERFSSGKRFRQDFYPHSTISSFSCFKNTFLGTFSSGQIGTSLLPGRTVYILELLFSLGEWFTFWNFSSPWENGLHFGTSLLPGRMVQFFNSHQSFFPNRWGFSRNPRMGIREKSNSKAAFCPVC